MLAFKPFDEQADVRIYCNGFLPHWRQKGCTYFVTFRLTDSIPIKVVEQWRYERDKWLAARGFSSMSENTCGSIMRQLLPQERQDFERHFAGKMFEYLDRGYGACHLRNLDVRQVVADAMMYFDGDRAGTGDYVLMPNHVHALLTPLGDYELEQILHSIKSFTSNQINRLLGRAGTLWMKESHDRIVRDMLELKRTQDYIRRNPEKAKLDRSEYDHRPAEYALNLS